MKIPVIDLFALGKPTRHEPVGQITQPPSHDTRFCPKHETRLNGRYCDLCRLESLTGRTHRSVQQIMDGCVAPSWEREQL